jgi:hypothetical protein
VNPAPHNVGTAPHQAPSYSEHSKSGSPRNLLTHPH